MATYLETQANLLGDNEWSVDIGPGMGNWHNWAAFSGFDYPMGCYEESGQFAENSHEFSNKGWFDYIARKYYHYGQNHGGTAFRRFLEYDEATNLCSRAAIPFQDNGHGYQHTAGDPNRGLVYRRRYGSSIIDIFTISSGAWTGTTQPPIGESQSGVAGALEWFYERDSLIFMLPQTGIIDEQLVGDVWERAGSTGTWTLLGNPVAGPYHSVSTHSVALGGTVPLGGGNDTSQLYRVNNAGALSLIADAPAFIGSDGGLTNPGALFWADPVTGELFLMVRPNYDVYINTLSPDSWVLQPGFDSPLFDAPHYSGMNSELAMITATPLKHLGVTLFLKYVDPDNAFAFLFKRAESGPSGTLAMTIKG